MIQNEMHSITTQLFLAQYDRWVLERDHFDCSNSRCKRLEVSSEDYKTVHVDSECQCSFQGLSDIAETINTGNMVAIEFHESQIQATLIPVLGPKPVYVAISHVWSDGMGNPKCSALPECHLTSLQMAVSYSCKSSVNIPFWIDTICVPLDDSEARKLAIGRMRDIYHDARHVLVIGNTMQMQSSKVPRVEIFMAITMSSWAKRLWTLQEGRLAQKLKFLFRDDIVDLPSFDAAIGYVTKDIAWPFTASEIAAAYRSSGDDDSVLKLLSAMALRSVEAREERQVDVGESRELLKRLVECQNHKSLMVDCRKTVRECMPLGFHYREAWQDTYLAVRSLRSRSTTKQEDEPICLAALLGIPVAPLLALPFEQRMRRLLYQIRTFPRRILFFTGEREQEVGLRWMPNHF